MPACHRSGQLRRLLLPVCGLFEVELVLISSFFDVCNGMAFSQALRGRKPRKPFDSKTTASTPFSPPAHKTPSHDGTLLMAISHQCLLFASSPLPSPPTFLCAQHASATSVNLFSALFACVLHAVLWLRSPECLGCAEQPAVQRQTAGSGCWLSRGMVLALLHGSSL